MKEVAWQSEHASANSIVEWYLLTVPPPRGILGTSVHWRKESKREREREREREAEDEMRKREEGRGARKRRDDRYSVGGCAEVR